MAFLVVNTQSIDLADALHWSSISDTHPFLEATVERAVLHQYAETQGLEVTSEDVQNESDRIRYAFELADPNETERWLRSHDMNVETFTKACAYSALRNKVRDNISDETIQQYYADHEDQFVEVDLYVIRRHNAKKLHQLAEQLRAGDLNFHLEAIRQSEDPETAPHGGYVGRLRRDEVPEDLAVSIFSVDPGDIIGPITDQDGHILMLMKQWRLLPLDEIRGEVRDIVFGQLIAELTKIAVVSAPSDPNS